MANAVSRTVSHRRSTGSAWGAWGSIVGAMRAIGAKPNSAMARSLGVKTPREMCGRNAPLLGSPQKAQRALGADRAELGVYRRRGRSRASARGEGSGPRCFRAARRFALPVEAKRLEPLPELACALHSRGVYGRHARPRPGIEPLAPFAANWPRPSSRGWRQKAQRALGVDRTELGVYRRRGRSRASARTRGIRAEVIQPYLAFYLGARS